MEFKAFRITKRFADGSYSYDELPRTEYGVTMRARRAARYTSQLRRKG